MSLARYTKLLLVAFSISFVGSLPIGTLNTSVANFALNNNFTGAFQFGSAAILVEVMLVRIAVTVIDKLRYTQVKIEQRLSTMQSHLHLSSTSHS